MTVSPGLYDRTRTIVIRMYAGTVPLKKRSLLRLCRHVGSRWLSRVASLWAAPIPHGSDGCTHIETDVDKLTAVALTSKLGTIYGLRIQKNAVSESSLGVLTIRASARYPVNSCVGLSVMVIGKDVNNSILWACCLVGWHNMRLDNRRPLSEWLVVSRDVFGKTRRVFIAVNGLTGPSEPRGLRRVGRKLVEIVRWPGSSRKHERVESDGIILRGRSEFIQSTTEALALLRRAGSLDMVRQNIKTIREGRQTCVNVQRRIVRVCAKHWSGYKIDYACAIAHEAHHVVLFQQARDRSWWSGAAAEKKCMEVELQILSALEGPEWKMEFLRLQMEDATDQVGSWNPLTYFRRLRSRRRENEA
jgi:hypothetical protein